MNQNRNALRTQSWVHCPKEARGPGTVGHDFRRGIKFPAVGFATAVAAVMLGAFSSPAGAAPVTSTEITSGIPREWCSVWTRPPMTLPRYQQIDAPLLGNGDIGVAIGGEPENQQFWLSKNDLWELRSVWCRSGPRPFGHLDVRIPLLQRATYHVEQNLADATTLSTFKSDEANVTMRSWVSATENLLVVELSCEGRPVEGDVELWVPALARTTPQVDHRPPPGMARDWIGMPAAPIQDDGAGISWGIRAFRENVEIPAEVVCAFRLIGGKNRHFHLEPGRPVTLVAALESLRQTKEYVSAARQLVSSADQHRLEELHDKHVKWWRAFWDKSAVNLGDPELEWRYHVSNYILASCSRDLDYPPGLAGVWVTTDQPMWTGAYTMNYNHEACFYGLYSSNHIEQADPEDGPVLAFRERGEFYAREVMNCRGVLYPVKFGPMGIETTADPEHPNIVTKVDDPPWLRQKGGLFLGQRSDAAFAAVNMAQRWYTTYDPAYGRKVYPYIRDVALFWEDYMKFEPTPVELIQATENLPKELRQPPDGRYVIYKDGAFEGGQDTNPVISLGMVRNIMKLALDMSHELGINEPEREKWKHISDHLSAISVEEQKGDTVIQAIRASYIYPAGGIGLGSDPQVLAIARNTIKRATQWVTFNGSSSFFPAAVRVGYDPDVVWEKLQALAFHSNGIIHNEGHMLENCSVVPNTVDEMLLQSHEHILRLFPVWPRNRDAQYRTLRAYGAFLVSASLNGGMVKDVVLVSEKGRPCVVQNPWPGQQVQLQSDAQGPRTVTGERLEFKTLPGERITLIPVAGVPPAPAAGRGLQYSSRPTLKPLMNSTPLKHIAIGSGLLMAVLGFGAPAATPGGSVTVTEDTETATLTNNIVSLTVKKTNGNILSLRRYGVELMSRGGGYWNIYGATPGQPNTEAKGLPAEFRVSQNPEQNGGSIGEIALRFPYLGQPKAVPLDIEIRYTLHRGDSGVYGWTIADHDPKYPAFNIEVSTVCLKLNPEVFDFLSVDKARQRLMPSPEDWVKGTQLNLWEARRLNTGVHQGEAEHKYDYNALFSETPAWGWSSTKQRVGLYIVNPSIEYINAPPTMVDYGGHIDVKASLPADPCLLFIWHSPHYGGRGVEIKAGELWQKIVGPFLIYTNTAQNSEAMWRDALARAGREQKLWPYAWAEARGYLHAQERGTAAGEVVIHDSQAPRASTAHGWIGLAQPSYVAKLKNGPTTIEWQHDGKHYQYWSRLDADGHFEIRNARPGVYTLYAFADGILGEFSKSDIRIEAGKTATLGRLDWTPVRYGRQLWEIGVPNRSAEEFRHGDHFWQWGLYNLYATEFPHDVDFVVGKSDWKHEWNYAQPPHDDGEGRWKDSTWKIRFDVDRELHGTCTLRLAICGARGGPVDVTVNGQPIGTTGELPESGVMHRDGIRATALIERNLTFDAGLLKKGENVVALTKHARAWTDGVLYDYLRLEVNETVK